MKLYLSSISVLEEVILAAIFMVAGHAAATSSSCCTNYEVIINEISRQNIGNCQSFPVS